MKPNKQFFFVLLALMLCVSAAQARVRLPHILSSNMVLQQNTSVRLWGWAKPNATIKITINKEEASISSLSSQDPQRSTFNVQRSTSEVQRSTFNVQRIKVGKDGKWTASFSSPAASYVPYSITFDDGESTEVIENVLFGEVWVCAGQSNMEMPIKGFDDCPVEDYQQVVVESARKSCIRFCKIPSRQAMKPQEDADCKWQMIGINTVGDASATGFFFGNMLQSALDIPIGLIEANKGGSRVESWMTEETLRSYTDEPLDTMQIVANYKEDYKRPLTWGNATFNPIINFTIKGLIFYQGCSNVGNPGNQYSTRLKLLVEQWRRQFRQGDFPFYMVEIAPFDYGGPNGTAGARLREQQHLAAKSIPNADIVSTNDLVYPYEAHQIHPAQKKKVGERLACLALNHDYGMKNLRCEGAKFKELRISSDTCYVTLTDHYKTVCPMEQINGFEIAGEDRVFHPAKATYKASKGIMLTSPNVPHPVAVRYCFRDFQIGNVKNGAMLPLFPFRTDDWE